MGMDGRCWGWWRGKAGRREVAPGGAGFGDSTGITASLASGVKRRRLRLAGAAAPAPRSRAGRVLRSGLIAVHSPLAMQRGGGGAGRLGGPAGG